MSTMIGSKMKALRLKQGLSLTELADRANVAKSYLSKIEKDETANPSVQFLEKISGVLGVSIEVLLLEEDEHSLDQADAEWRAIVLEAMESGVSKEQFRDFIQYNKWRNDQDQQKSK